MKKKIVLAIDSYKGCLSSEEVEQAAASGIRAVFPQTEVCCIPLADGGEGMMEVMVTLTGGKTVAVETHDPLQRPIRASYGVLGDGETAVVEMAQASGLPLLTVDERNPMLTTTYGTGEIIREVIQAGYRKIIMGLGGSATNDGGMGMMQALGAHFYNERGEEVGVGCGQLLEQVSDISLTDFRQQTEGVEWITACDVNNPLCGPQGAARVFSPQKGATAAMVDRLDNGLCHFAGQIALATGIEVMDLPGAGAAGGMGGCLSAFFHSELCPGIELILKELDFRRRAENAVLLVTGEGKSDAQTLMGKVPAGVLKAGKEMQVDVVLMSGAIDEAEPLLSAGFARVKAVTPLELPLETAMQPEVARMNIQKAIVDVVHPWLT